MPPPHDIKGVLKQLPDQWLSNTCLTHYQNVLPKPPQICTLASTTLNPASLLLDPDLKGPLHDSVGILSQVHRDRKNLFDHPILDTEVLGTQMLGALYKTDVCGGSSDVRFWTCLGFSPTWWNFSPKSGADSSEKGLQPGQRQASQYLY